ncbi:MAG: hypothetical protein ACREOO_03150 [bacterium]
MPSKGDPQSLVHFTSAGSANVSKGKPKNRHHKDGLDDDSFTQIFQIPEGAMLPSVRNPNEITNFSDKVKARGLSDCAPMEFKASSLCQTDYLCFSDRLKTEALRAAHADQKRTRKKLSFRVSF